MDSVSVVRAYLADPGVLRASLTCVNAVAGGVLGRDAGHDAVSHDVGTSDPQRWIEKRRSLTALPDLTFTNRVFVYAEQRIPDVVNDELVEAARAAGLRLEIRDGAYAAAKSRIERPEAFICHDSRDKDVAREIAKKLSSRMCTVWYDDGGDEPSYLEVPLSKCKEFSRPGCSHCPDFAAQHADVSLGGIGSQAGRTLAISRSELGDEILYDMEYDGLITVSDAVTEDPDAVALIQKLAVLQRKRWLGASPDSGSFDVTPAMVPQPLTVSSPTS